MSFTWGMDATHPQTHPEQPSPPPRATAGDAVGEPTQAPPAVQEALPLALDAPIPYALTARARRYVAPDGLPDLAVVARGTTASAVGRPESREARPDQRQRRIMDAAPIDLDDPHDTRPSRARALRRAGLGVADIAGELDAEDLEVRAWIDGVTPVRSATRRLRAVDAAARDEAAHAAARQRFDQARLAGREEAADRLDDPSVTTGLALLSGVAEIGPHAVLCTVREPAVGAAVLGWLRRVVDIQPARVRVLLRLAPQVAADQAAHDWAAQLDVAPDAVAYTRWRGAPDAEAVEATIRIADPRLAGRLAGWREALLTTLADPDAAAPTPEDATW